MNQESETEEISRNLGSEEYVLWQNQSTKTLKFGNLEKSMNDSPGSGMHTHTVV